MLFRANQVNVIARNLTIEIATRPVFKKVLSIYTIKVMLTPYVILLLDNPRGIVPGPGSETKSGFITAWVDIRQLDRLCLF